MERHNIERSRHFYGTMAPLQIVSLSDVYGLFYYLTQCHERFVSHLSERVTDEVKDYF